MNKNNLLLLAFLFSFTLAGTALPAQQWASGYGSSLVLGNTTIAPKYPKQDYTANFSVSHGHCQTPFDASFSNVKILYQPNMKGLQIDFDVNAQSIVAVGNPKSEFTESMKGKDRFDAKHYPVMRFLSDGVYNLGKDWFQLNGKLTIKDKTVQTFFHVRPVYDQMGNNRVLRKFVLDGEVQLKDFGISGSMVDGDDVPGRTMYMNLVLKADDGC